MSVVRDLDVWIDAELLMRHHTSRITRAYSLTFTPSQIYQHASWSSRFLDVTVQFVCAPVLSRLDYCNAVYTGLPAETLVPRSASSPFSHVSLTS